MHGDPPGPVDLVEEPVHHDEQHDDREQSGRCLDVERWDILREAVDDADRDAPGEERRGKRHSGAGRYRALVGTPLAGHVCGNCCQDQDALESLTEHKDRDVEHARTKVTVPGGVREAAGGEHLEDEHAGNQRRADGEDTCPERRNPHVMKAFRDSRPEWSGLDSLYATELVVNRYWGDVSESPMAGPQFF